MLDLTRRFRKSVKLFEKLGSDSWGALIIVATVLMVTLVADSSAPHRPVDASTAVPGDRFSIAQILRFQTAIAALAVGLVGFAGVIVTLIANAKIGRKQQRSAIQHERETVRVSLSIELETIRDSMSNDIPKLGELGHEDDLLWIPKHRNIDIYKSVIPKLGLLSTGQQRNVLSAYGLIQDLPQRLTVLSRKPIPEIHFAIGPEHHDTIANLYKITIGLIDQALDSLEAERTS